jgi:nicotinamidase-related amidase
LEKMTMSYERLTPHNTALLMVDHQTGLANGVQTQSPVDFVNNIEALAHWGKLYALPTIITTSAADGPNARSCQHWRVFSLTQRLCIAQGR